MKNSLKNKRKIINDEDTLMDRNVNPIGSSCKRQKRTTSSAATWGNKPKTKMSRATKEKQNSKRKKVVSLDEMIGTDSEKKKNQHRKEEKELLTNNDSLTERDSEKVRIVNSKFVGAHCSIAGGVSNAVINAVSIGAEAFGLFVRNGRTWKLTPLAKEEAIKFKKLCKENNFPPHLILPHGSYLLNCGSSNQETLQKSRETLIHELQRCEMLGLSLYNFHPGSACGGGTVEQCINTIAESINLAHGKTKFVKTVIENMSCQGSTVGGKFEELKSIIDKVHDRSRIGVCLDTCHSFAAGFDLSTKYGLMKFLDEFDRKVGLKYLCAMHLNDSKGQLGCHLDRHENIGKGQIGIEGFSNIMKDPRLHNIPMILETPPDDYAGEIKLLYSLM